jgi:hypothetical protein
MAALIRSEESWHSKPGHPGRDEGATQSMAAMDFRGVASSHLDELSTMVNNVSVVIS